MPQSSKSLINLESFTHTNLNSFFKELDAQKEVYAPTRGTAALLFFENSTRTRLSFESACYRVGLGPLLLDANSGSSLVKGESILDTVLNVAAMGPKLIIIRAGKSFNMAELSRHTRIPIVNAGWGAIGHPTQALLDLYTLWKVNDLAKTKLLILGDLRHSRVAASHFEIFQRLGLQLGLCHPKDMGPIFAAESQKRDFKTFEKVEDGLRWCNAVMALRIQTERHDGLVTFDVNHYRREFGLNQKRLKNLAAEAIILHPGPVNHGIEIETDILSDPRCRILEQVSHGVKVRSGILQRILDNTQGEI